VLAKPALRPGVLDALLRTLGGEESFLYLNAVQGLVALALTPVRGTVGEARSELPGREVVATLLRGYAVTVDGTGDMSVEELDRRLRLGEALAQVIVHLQDAVTAYRALPCLLSSKPIQLTLCSSGHSSPSTLHDSTRTGQANSPTLVCTGPPRAVHTVRRCQLRHV